jgi:hypothetical protein
MASLARAEHGNGAVRWNSSSGNCSLIGKRTEHCSFYGLVICGEPIIAPPRVRLDTRPANHTCTKQRSFFGDGWKQEYVDENNCSCTKLSFLAKFF